MFKCLPLMILLCFAGIKVQGQAREYFQHISKAEDELIQENYGIALEWYGLAFTLTNGPYLKDVHNAILCAAYEKDTSSLVRILHLLDGFDLQEEFLQVYTSNVRIQNDTFLVKTIDDYLQGRKSSYEKDCLFYEKLNSLDQSIRSACKEIHLNYYSLCEKEIRILDSINLSSLLNRFYTVSFPGDADLCNINPSSPPPYYLTIKHNLQWGRDSILHILARQVDSLKYHPQLYAELVDYLAESYYKEKSRYGNNYHCALGERIFIFSPNDEDAANIDSARAHIYLEPLSTFNHKISFQFFHPEFYLVYPQLIFRLNTSSEEEAMLIEKWKDVEVNKDEIPWSRF